MITVTPTMFMGPPEDAGVWPELIPVDNASDAFTVVRSGQKALIPPGAWDIAEATIRLCGIDDEAWIERSLGWAKDAWARDA